MEWNEIFGMKCKETEKIDKSIISKSMRMFLLTIRYVTNITSWFNGFRLRLGHFKKNMKFLFSPIIIIIIIIVKFFQLYRIERPKVHKFILKNSIFEKLTSKLKVKILNKKNHWILLLYPWWIGNFLLQTVFSERRASVVRNRNKLLLFLRYGIWKI